MIFPDQRRRPRHLICALLLVLAYSLPIASESHSTEHIPTLVIEGHEYISIQDLADLLSAQVKRVPLKSKVILLRPHDRDLVFTILGSVYLVGQVQFRAPTPSRIEDGILYVSSDIGVALGLRQDSLTESRIIPADPAPRHPVGQTFQPPSVAELKERWAIDRIVIDAGHGGKDPGAVGPGGTREKDITLAIAKKLGARLKKSLGTDVIYTRTADTFIKYGRTRIARESKGDLFVSLHCNAGHRRGANGIEVYFLSEAKTAAAAAAAERENAAFELESDSQEDDKEENTLIGMVTEIRTSQYLKESQDLASGIRSSMAKRFKDMDDRGVKQANFYVMRGTMGAMPSVLVEMGFISNPTEEKRLKTRSFQKNMADAIFEGIKSFKQIHEKQLPNAK